MRRRTLADLAPLDPTSPLGIRMALGLTQAEIAEAFGVTPNTWSRWERGEFGIHKAHKLRMDRIGRRLTDIQETAIWLAESERRLAALKQELSGATAPQHQDYIRRLLLPEMKTFDDLRSKYTARIRRLRTELLSALI